MLTKFVIDGDDLVNFVRCILCLKAKGSKIINNQTFFFCQNIQGRRKPLLLFVGWKLENFMRIKNVHT
jgi:hypothetical protein